MAGRTALLLAALAIGGCYESPVPLDPAPQADIDPGLVGAWRCLPPSPAADDEAVTITVAKTARDRVYEARFIEDGKDPDRYEGYVSLVGGRPVVNLRDLDATNGKPWTFARYELLRPDILEISIAADDVLSGTEPTAAALRKRMESLAKDARLFGGFAVCVRQKKG
jgi:hypothetical protein